MLEPLRFLMFPESRSINITECTQTYPKEKSLYDYRTKHKYCCRQVLKLLFQDTFKRVSHQLQSHIQYCQLKLILFQKFAHAREDLFPFLFTPVIGSQFYLGKFLRAQSKCFIEIRANLLFTQTSFHLRKAI